MSEVSSSNSELLLQQALAHARGGRVKDALNTYKDLLQADPGNALAHYKMGSLLVEIGKTEAAIPHLQAAHDLSPGHQQMWFLYLKALLAAKRLGEARTALANGLQSWGFAGERASILHGDLQYHEQAATAAPDHPVRLPDVDDNDFYKILGRAWPHSMSSKFGFVEAFYSLYQNVCYVVDRGIPGAFVECGCYFGGMSLLAALTFLRRGDTSRHIYLFDTFEGMPAPTTEDGDMAAKSYALNTQSGQTWAKANVEAVRSTMMSSGYPADKIHIVKGMVEDTIPASVSGDIAILRLDTDFYASIKHTLVHLYPRLSQGGVVIFDDYGAIVGARRAVDEYFSTAAKPILLQRVNYTVRVGIKT